MQVHSDTLSIPLAPSIAEETRMLVQSIRYGDSEAEGRLYSRMRLGVFLFLRRRVGAEYAEDLLHEVLIDVLKAIRADQIREPERIFGFITVVASNKAARFIEGQVKRRDESVEPIAPLRSFDVSADNTLDVTQRVEIMKAELLRMRAQDREILERFYLREETPEQICDAMNLTPNQFRLNKSRAKARLTGVIATRRPSKLVIAPVRVTAA